MSREAELRELQRVYEFMCIWLDERKADVLAAEDEMIDGFAPYADGMMKAAIAAFPDADDDLLSDAGVEVMAYWPYWQARGRVSNGTEFRAGIEREAREERQ